MNSAAHIVAGELDRLRLSPRNTTRLDHCGRNAGICTKMEGYRSNFIALLLKFPKTYLILIAMQWAVVRNIPKKHPYDTHGSIYCGTLWVIAYIMKYPLKGPLRFSFALISL